MGNRSGALLPKFRLFRRLSSKSSPHADAATIGDTSLETFLLVWLDPSVDTSKENIKNQKRLRKILTCLITFHKVDTCEQWLKKCCPDAKIILIVSGAYAEEIVPRIHDLPAIVSIHVYCLDISRNKRWAENYSKIRSVQSSTDVLLEELSHNQIKLENVEDSKALKIYKSEGSMYSVDMKTASLIWYQLLLEILIVPDYLSTQGTYDEFIEILRQYSAGNEYGSELIKEFEETYEPREALSWLIRDTPLIRFVNKALREQDINILFPLRFLLVDIHNQLIQHQASALNVFKLQLMSQTQMEDLKANPGQLMVFHGFLFTSTNRSQLMSTITNNNQFETILFDIKADVHPGTAPFAFLRQIDSNIEAQTDREVLFMCGSIFEVGPLICENSLWILHLRLKSENDIPMLFNMKQKMKDTRNLNIIKDLLEQANHKDKARIYNERLQLELSKTHSPQSPTTMQTVFKPTSPSINNNLFLLIHLSDYLTEYASAVLKILSKYTQTINDDSTVDCSQWSNKSITIFTAARFASSLENVPQDCKIFLFDKRHNDIETQRYNSIDDLINRLVDEIIDKYRMEINQCTNNKDLDTAKKLNEQINRIYRQVRHIHEKLQTNQTAMAIADNPLPILVWLTTATENNEEDINYINENFEKYFSPSPLIYFQDDEFHAFIATAEYTTDLFVIIDSSYRESISTGIRQFSNIKHVYRYGESKTKDNQVISNRNDLRYYITTDLIDYYGKFGQFYRINKQEKKAREMYKKAKSLCQILSNSFSAE